MEINGKPLLWYVVNRLKKAKSIDKIVVATTDNASDDIIMELCRGWDIDCYRGSEKDVLDRFYKAALKFKMRDIVRITADCPLIDYRLVDEIVRFYQEKNCDYVSNNLEPNYPDGMDIEIFRFSALEAAWKHATLGSEREHVTPFIYKNSNFNGEGRFSVANYGYDINFSNIRLTVDEKEDFEVVRFLIEKTDLTTPWLGYVALLTQNMEMLLRNSKFERDEGYEISLTEDVLDSISIGGTSRNLYVQERAKDRIPGMTQLLSKRPDQFSSGVWPGYFSKAKGVEVWDLDGNRFVDMSIFGIGANVLGYADPDVDTAVKRAILMGTNSSLNCPEEIVLADLLCKIHPWAEKVRYARTGGEAMAIAIRIARAYTGRDKIAFCGYHGWHDWYLSANLNSSDDALGDHLLPGLNPRGVPKQLANTSFPFHYNRLDELGFIIDKHQQNLAAIVMEPIRNDLPEPGFLEGVRRLADKCRAVLVIDEISAGWRLNSGGAHLELDITPDIAVFSKAIGNGYPIAAVIGKGHIMDAAQSTFISSSYWTERIGPTAAIATIRKHLEFEVGNHLKTIGNQVQSGWRELAHKHGLRIRVGGIPPLSHFVFEYDNALSLKALFVQLMLDQYFLAAPIFYASFAHKREHVEAYLEAVDKAFKSLAEANESNRVDSLLRGKPSVAGFKRLL